MSGGNGIRLRIMSKYNLVTYQKLSGWIYQHNPEFKLFIFNSNGQSYAATRRWGFIWKSTPYFDPKKKKTIYL